MYLTVLITIVSTVKHCLTTMGEIDTITDGADNCFEGDLIIGKEDDGSPKIINVSFCGGTGVKGTPTILADFLQEAGVKMCILGIGKIARPMMNEMLGRKNVFCEHIEHSADTKSIVSIVRTLKHASNGGPTTVTRNGVQHALLVSLTDEVQESIKSW